MTVSQYVLLLKCCRRLGNGVSSSEALVAPGCFKNHQYTQYAFEGNTDGGLQK